MTSAALLVFLALVSFGHGAKEKPELSEEIKEIIQHVHNECVGKTGVAEEDIANCENGIFKEDTKLKCYMFCLLDEGSLVDDDGNVDYDMMISLIPEKYTDRVSKMINACKGQDTKDKDNCQRAFDVHKCSYAADPDVHKAIIFELCLHRSSRMLSQHTFYFDKEASSEDVDFTKSVA